MPTTVNDLSSEGWDTTGQSSELTYRGYFSQTPSPYNDDRHWYTHFHFGYQGYNMGAADYGFVWAVRDGDVAQVPEPASLGLLGFGMAGAAIVRRRRKS